MTDKAMLGIVKFEGTTFQRQSTKHRATSPELYVLCMCEVINDVEQFTGTYSYVDTTQLNSGMYKPIRPCAIYQEGTQATRSYVQVIPVVTCGYTHIIPVLIVYYPPETRYSLCNVILTRDKGSPRKRELAAAVNNRLEAVLT